MKKKGEITQMRGRVIKMLDHAKKWNERCYVLFHVVGGPSHDSICDDAMDLLCGRATLGVSFRIAETMAAGIRMGIRSEQSWIVKPEPTVVDGKLPKLSQIKKPESAGVVDSLLWHFAGGLWYTDCGFGNELVEHSCGFCEYDADKKQGSFIFTFDGAFIPQFSQVFPQQKSSIKVLSSEQDNWLHQNW